MGEVRIGISGWRYAGLRGTFYPETLAQKMNWLLLVANFFASGVLCLARAPYDALTLLQRLTKFQPAEPMQGAS